MDPVISDGQNIPFSRLNEPSSRCYSSLSFLVILNSDIIFPKKFHGRLLKDYIWIQLALTPKTANFQRQTILIAGKLPILPIFVWKQLALTAKMAHFQGQTIPRIGKPPFTIFFDDPEFCCHFCQKNLWTSVKTLAMDQLALTVKTTHFQGQTNPKADLDMESVGSHGQNNLFSRSYDPWSKIPSHFLPNFSWTFGKILAMVQLALTSKTAHFQGQMNPGAAVELVDIDSQNDLFSRSNEPRNSPQSFLMIRNFDIIFAKKFYGHLFQTLAMEPVGLTTRMAHFQGQTSPKAGKPPFLPIFFIFKVKRSPEKTFIKISVMEPVGTDGQNGLFSRSNESQSRIETSFLVKNFMDVRYDLSYEASWS
ncbi:hypothetical protein H5410_052984 [Solanum commersonii]|uniref:Uncharacterized protein n=1 Tax=Solanum commersonii TaxID=4109 RepID=A0A9J5X4N0_SOLCO|nr:hypothetical protein H5410_052984 [Solanum commersonii]